MLIHNLIKCVYMLINKKRQHTKCNQYCCVAKKEYLITNLFFYKKWEIIKNN